MTPTDPRAVADVLGPWLRHDPTCDQSVPDSPDSDWCTCGLADALASLPGERREGEPLTATEADRFRHEVAEWLPNLSPESAAAITAMLQETYDRLAALPVPEEARPEEGEEP